MHQNGYGRGARLAPVRVPWLLAVAVAGCASPAPGIEAPVDPLAALGLVAVEHPFALDGTTLCLPGEGGDDVACEPGEGSRILLGPFDAIITGINVTATWEADRPTTQRMRLSLWCHQSGATDNPSRCDEVADQQVTGSSPLAISLADLQTPTTAVLEIRLTETETPAGRSTRQAFHAAGIVTYASEPDATNQA